jgi:hypothetical protein
VVTLVLGFTAVPAQLSLSWLSSPVRFDFDFNPLDIVSNLIMYVPVGAVLASRTVTSTLSIAAAVSAVAEFSQLFTYGRSASVVDILSNVIGTAVGWSLGSRLGIPFRVLIGRRLSVCAAALSVAYLVVGLNTSPRDVEEAIAALLPNPRLLWRTTNPRGATAEGVLEAHWNLDESNGSMTPDSSGNGLAGVLVNSPTFGEGVDGPALILNGVDQYVDLGDPPSLQLRGSMTITAWINSAEFPVDDAAIVSNHSGLGYQLDTTVDQGPRTIGFKLANAAGRLMARYGKTTLETNRWYHVAAVYDSEAQSLNVYLDGRIDNGCLLGSVTSRQTPSGLHVFVGRRGNADGYGFAGSVDDVRVYSRPLSESEIVSQVKASAEVSNHLVDAGTQESPVETGRTETRCPETNIPDARRGGMFVAFGGLLALACVGLWPASHYRFWAFFASCAGGLAASWMAVDRNLPHFGPLVVLLTLMGGVSVVAALRR